MKLRIHPAIIFSVILTGLTTSALGQMTPQQAVVKMTRGFNMGRSLELPNEGDAGGRFIQEYFFDDIKNAGFNFVRVPVQWDQHTGTTAPYTVDSTWLDRVGQVIDWGLERDLIVIINSHHDRWILEDLNYTAGDLARFDAIWRQVADRFQARSENLLFEIANEPALYTNQVDQINARIVPIIRSNNPTRIIIYGGPGTQLNRLKTAIIPPNDAYLMGSFHTYLPSVFALDGLGTWGTAAERQVVTNLFADAAAWSQQNNIPILLGEFGTIGNIDRPSREIYIATHVGEASRTGIAPCVWHDFGNFSIYNPNNSLATRWSYVKDVIMASSNPAPTNPPVPPLLITALSVPTNAVVLTWASGVGKSYTVEYSLGLSNWTSLITNIPAAAATNRTSAVINVAGVTNTALVQYQMEQAGPQLQDASNTLAGGALTKGSGLSTFNTNSTQAYPTTPSLAITFTGNYTNLPTSLSNAAWFTFTVTAGAGVTDCDLTSLTFHAARGGAGTPRGYGVFVTTPTTTDELLQAATDLPTQRFDWGTLQTIDLASVASLQNLSAGQAVTFKLAAYAPTAGSAIDFDNITVNGKVAPAGIPAHGRGRLLFLRVRQQ
jgi:hypothetical protein